MNRIFQKILFLLVSVILLNGFVPLFAAVSRKPTLLLFIDLELQNLVSKVDEIYPVPLSEFKINEKILKAALLFDALGAYGLEHKSSDENSLFFPELVNADSLNLSPAMSVFTKLKGNNKELSLLYAAVLEASGLTTAILQSPKQLLVLFNTGVHKKYSGAISRDITSYLILSDHVWMPVDVSKIGKPFYSGWLSSSGKLIGETLHIIPFAESIQNERKVRRVKIFRSRITKTGLNKIFEKDRNYFEGEKSQAKLIKVSEVMKQYNREAVRHTKKGTQLLNSGFYDDAISEFNESIKFGGDSGVTLFFIAKALGEKKDFQKMKQVGIKLIEYDHRDARGYKILGFAYYYSGEPNIGELFFKKSRFLENKMYSVK